MLTFQATKKPNPLFNEEDFDVQEEAEDYEDYEELNARPFVPRWAGGQH